MITFFGGKPVFIFIVNVDFDIGRLLTGCRGRYGGGGHYARVLSMRGRCSSHGSPGKPITWPIRVLTDLH